MCIYICIYIYITFDDNEQSREVKEHVKSSWRLGIGSGIFSNHTYSINTMDQFEVTARRVKHLENGLKLISVSYMGVIFSFLFFTSLSSY